MSSIYENNKSLRKVLKSINPLVPAAQDFQCIPDPHIESLNSLPFFFQQVFSILVKSMPHRLFDIHAYCPFLAKIDA